MDSQKKFEQKNLRGDGFKKGRTATSRRMKRANKKRGKRYVLKDRLRDGE